MATTSPSDADALDAEYYDAAKLDVLSRLSDIDEPTARIDELQAFIQHLTLPTGISKEATRTLEDAREDALNRIEARVEGTPDSTDARFVKARAIVFVETVKTVACED